LARKFDFNPASFCPINFYQSFLLQYELPNFPSAFPSKSNSRSTVINSMRVLPSPTHFPPVCLFCAESIQCCRGGCRFADGHKMAVQKGEWEGGRPNAFPSPEGGNAARTEVSQLTKREKGGRAQ
jgi:hypothetical protein